MAYTTIASYNEVGLYNIYFNSKAMPTTDTNYSCHINIAEPVQPIAWGSYHANSYLQPRGRTQTHTHTHTQTCIQTIHTESILRSQEHFSWCVTGLKIQGPSFPDNRVTTKFTSFNIRIHTVCNYHMQHNMFFIQRYVILHTYVRTYLHG